MNDGEKPKSEKRKKVEKVGWFIAFITIILFVSFTSYFIYVLGQETITLHTITFAFVITFYPVATFILGMFLIMKMKVYPLRD
ncbi:hypothetical protein KAU43_01445 [candidate division WOR-3 bacterium]|nr:hypothetical protein [candidate division WOR-3 bacterium]